MRPFRTRAVIVLLACLSLVALHAQPAMTATPSAFRGGGVSAALLHGCGRFILQMQRADAPAPSVPRSEPNAEIGGASLASYRS